MLKKILPVLMALLLLSACASQGEAPAPESDAFTIAGVPMAIMMSNSGGAWDNAKKYIERGNHGGKGSDQHKAAVVGDTVGDPFKDTSGPSLNILIKLCSTVSIVFSGLIIAFSIL